MLLHTLGTLAMDAATIIYCFLFLPQLWHNRRPQHISHMSFAYHSLLLVAVYADLFYGFGRIHQWQYQLVGVIAVISLSTEHMQWYQIARQLKIMPAYTLVTVTCLILTLAFCVYWKNIPLSLAMFMGWVARVGYITHKIPQIIKNHLQPAAAIAISRSYLYLCLLLGTLDGFAAWALDWGAPSKYGTPINIIFSLILIHQNAKLNKQFSAPKEAYS
jgi:hypothetical protein